MRDTLEIRDARTADAFRTSRQRSLLLALIEEELSSSELSRLTGTPLNLLHHHLRKLLRLGLVRMTHQQKRAGAPIKFYRAVARRFFVPAELMGALPGAELTARLRERLQQSLTSTLDGVVFFSDAGRPRMRLVEAAGSRRIAADLWLELRLSSADAALLVDELRALLRRFGSRSSRSRSTWLVHAALAPG